MAALHDFIASAKSSFAAYADAMCEKELMDAAGLIEETERIGGRLISRYV